MVEFKRGEPITTETPTIAVTINPEQPLRPGRHRFQLVVEDDSNNQSEPDTVDVIVLDTERPTAVLEAQPSQVKFQQDFVLSGKQSSDAGGGRIVKYIWTLL
ncbi:hypothetical protein ACQ4M4_21830 [Leptolyngbya sp. AN02str]|uniref:hypothetical protein n=1 Tax=Leptolyngbya sp. AN02str TaxID=3423363 RepID=UPI003D31D802